MAIPREQIYKLFPKENRCEPHGPPLWLDIVDWQSRAAALQAAEIFPTLERAHAFVALIDEASMTMLHLDPVRTW